MQEQHMRRNTAGLAIFFPLYVDLPSTPPGYEHHNQMVLIPKENCFGVASAK